MADTQPDADLLQLALPVSQKVVLIVDVVESVRLMASNEADAVGRWLALAQAGQDAITAHQGRVVKSLGDGLMAEFDQPRQAVTAALQLHTLAQMGNAARRPEDHMLLRAGVHATHVYVGGQDIYGAGVNLAARVATLAGPGETVVTAEVRDGLTDGLDAAVEDLGECYLKHIEGPVRVYRVGVAGARPVIAPRMEDAKPLQPVISVIPFASRSHAPQIGAIGELIADGLIGQLSRSPDLKVISRLSTTLLQGQTVSGRQRLGGSDFLVSGAFFASGLEGAEKLLITAEVTACSTGQVVWSDRLNGSVGDLLQAESEAIQRLTQQICHAVQHDVATSAASEALPSLNAFTLKIGGIAMMHRASSLDFGRGQAILEHLTERHRRASETHAWLAKWHILRVIRGESPNPPLDALRARDAVNRALDADPNNPLALAIQGYAQGLLLGDATAARHSLDRAIALSPNEGHAYLYRSVLTSINAPGPETVQDALRAKALSPLDPHTYFYDTILSSAYAAVGDHVNAQLAAKNALRLSRGHAPALRTLLLAQTENGQLPAARETLQDLLKATPGLTIAKYQAMGSADAPGRVRMVNVFRVLGLPEH